jgi:hypothetical protein
MIALVITAGSASAQCVVGAYADAAGTISVTAPTQFVTFSVYVILRDNTTVEGASYTISFPTGINVVGRFMGPNGAGFEFLTDIDPAIPPLVPQWFETIVGFGECAIGFGGNDILVARYDAVALDPNLVSVEVALTPNASQNPVSVEYATCSGQIVPCDGLQNLLITHVIGTESKSFGAVKSLY